MKPQFLTVLNEPAIQRTAGTTVKFNYNFDFSNIIKGNLLRLQNILLYGNFNAYDLIGADTESFTAYLRLIVVQAKTGGQTPPDDILQNSSDMTFTRSPFCQGFSQTVKLIYDKLYIINKVNNSRNIRVNLKKRLDNIRRRLVDNSDPENPVYQYDGNLFVFAYFGNTNGTRAAIKLNSKVMYVDED